MEKLNFKVSSALKDLVGKDLITNAKIAIFELVKNSYDAYATKVEIFFYEDKIVVADNGKGMSFDDIKEKWLFLGYSAKKDGTEDDIGKNTLTQKQKSYRDRIKRHYAGAKGIGRFSCDRLGKKLVLTTKSIRSKTIERIHVNWDDFDVDQKKKFDQVDVLHEVLKEEEVYFPEDGKSGTILEISNLNNEKSNWNRNDILELKRSLEKLINPLSEANDFSIEIICEREKKKDEAVIAIHGFDRDIVNGILKNSISEILNLKTTQIDVNLENNLIYTTISDRGIDIYKIREKNICFDRLVNAKINLYFLNRSAKVNFTRLMGIEPVNYGSIFLFRNGFRIMPFGEKGDDSWGLDYRAQQGNKRFLGTRDLFGRVDVLTDDIDDLKEVSSRDGGLIDTPMAKQLFAFFEIAHKRLERYVSGVLWGEAFLRKEYFETEAEALKNRRELLDVDKDEMDPNYVLSSSIGSKIDFVQLIKALTKDKNIEILYYNTELANIFSSQDFIGIVKPQFIKDLEKIAESARDPQLSLAIDNAKRKINELRKEKEAAEKKAAEAKQKQALAEEIAKKAEQAKIEAEFQRNKEAEEKRVALIRAKEAELKRREEEVLRKEAEQKRREEEERRNEAEKAKAALAVDLEREIKQGIFQRSIIGREKEQLLGLQHQISHSSGRIKNNVHFLLEHIKESSIHIDPRVEKIISVISLESAKIESLSNFVTCANFDLKASEINQDLALFIKEYIAEIYLPDIPILKSTLHIKVLSSKENFRLKFRPLEITTLIDNFVQNAEKANAKNILFSIKKNNGKILISIQDDGKGISPENISKIFDLGFTTTDGSGIGLFNVKSIVSRMGGIIEVKSVLDKETTFEVVL